MKTKTCTKCGKEKPIRSFGKLGKKRNTRCKQCVNEYQKSLRDLDKYNKERKKEEEIKIEAPIFEEEKNSRVKRTQIVLLAGDVDKLIKFTCVCGLGVHLTYQHSFDQKNDYYEGECPVCGKKFKLSITSK